MLQILLILLPYFVQSHGDTQIGIYENYARQMFDLENVSMKDDSGKEYKFEVTSKLDGWAMYEYRQHIHISETFPRKFKVAHPTGAASTFFSSKDSQPVTEYPKDTILEIIEYLEIPAENRIRGRVKDTLDWVSIINTDTGYMWCRPVVPAPVIKFVVETGNGFNKLHIEFTKLQTINRDSKTEDIKIFFNMFEKIYEHSPYPDTKLKLHDFYTHFQFQNGKKIVNQNLKFTHLFKTGKTFFEEFNFEYIAPVPIKLRQIMNEKLSLQELKAISEKFSKLNHFFEPTSIAKVVAQIEFFYSGEEFDEIFSTCFENSRFSMDHLVSTFPVDMIYKSAKKRFEIENTENVKRKTKVFTFSKASKKEENENRF